MSKTETPRISDVISQIAKQGANDTTWFMVEHQLVQVKMSIGVVVEALKDISSQPENADEYEVAMDCLDITEGMYRHIADHYAAFLSYLSDTDVPERISQKEV